MIILKMVGSLKTSKLSCGKLDQAPKDSGRQGLMGSLCLAKSHLRKDASCKREARWERGLWGVKRGAGLGPNSGSGTDNPRGPGEAFLGGMVELQGDPRLSACRLCTGPAGVLGPCPVPKARLPGFVSWLLLCCL